MMARLEGMTTRHASSAHSAESMQLWEGAREVCTKGTLIKPPMRGSTMAQIAACLWAACAVQAADSPQQHWVRGTLMRVSESVMSPGGNESDKVGSATPRVSGDGNKVVFYSDATFSSAGFEEDNDYHIWM